MFAEEQYYYVYMVTNKNNSTLYIGITSDLKDRLRQHKTKENKGFTARYNLDKLVYFEKTPYSNNAIKREKQIKKWNRKWKENLINDMNPDWDDLSWMFED